MMNSPWRKLFWMGLFCLLLSDCGSGRKDLLLQNSDYRRMYGTNHETRGIEMDLDGDSKPEILVAGGDSHAEGVSVFKKISTPGEYSYLGTYGSSATIEIAVKKGLIHSVYGNHGAVFDIVTRIGEEGAEPEIVLFLCPRMDGETRYYANISEEGLTGDNSFDYLMYTVPEEFQVSEEEYHKLYKGIIETEDWTEISYQSMKELDAMD